MIADPLQDRLKSAVLAHQRRDGRDENRDDHRLEHAARPGAHCREGFNVSQGAAAGAGDEKEHDPRPEDDEHVDAEQGRNQHREIRQCQPDPEGIMAEAARRAAKGQKCRDDQRHDRRRQRDFEVHLEFILHLDTLGLGRRDRRVRNEGQVIAEHRAADHGADADRQIQSRGVGHRRGDGNQHGDRPDARAHGHRNQTGDDEEPRHSKTRRHNVEQHVRGGRHAARRLRDAAEGPRQQKDEQHDRNVVVADALGADVDLFAEGQLRILNERDDQRDAEGHDDRHNVKAHLPLNRVNVLKIDAAAQIQN